MGWFKTSLSVRWETRSVGAVMSRRLVIGIGLIVCFLLLQSGEAHGVEYVVGDDQGWDLYPEVYYWGKDKHFKAGDVLVFKYTNPLFFVVAVDEEGYRSCNGKGHHHKRTYSSGNDHVVLKRGLNYFICGVMDYCGYGMRIAVEANK